MKRFFATIGYFFWSWSFLKFVLWTITLVIFLYVEEDWRGARAWAATKAEWEAKGESFDPRKFIPPPVPDDQNLVAIPLFKLEPDPENKGSHAPLALRKALRESLPGNDLNIPHSGNWMAGELSDMEKIRERVAANYNEAFKATSPSGDALAQFDALYPFLAELRAVAATRLNCRFPHDYPNEPEDFPGLFTAQIQTAKLLSTDALLALDAHKSGQALEDIKVNLRLISGLGQEPYIVSGLVAIGMNAIGGAGIYNGLTLHSWNDAQLADLQNELSKIDFLASYQIGVRGGLIVEVIAGYDNFKVNRASLATLVKEMRDSPESKIPRYDVFPALWPNGWLDWNKAQTVAAGLNAGNLVNLKARLVSPSAVDLAVAEDLRLESRVDAYAPWNIFFVLGAPVRSKEVHQFAIAQVWVDQMSIACALERYRLAHGVYPDALNALVPTYTVKLPHDLFTGGPYHYQLRPDGTFALYSVGWNQTDDGGKVIYKKDAPKQVDYQQGDWVWPTPQVLGAK